MCKSKLLINVVVFFNQFFQCSSCREIDALMAWKEHLVRPYVRPSPTAKSKSDFYQISHVGSLTVFRKISSLPVSISTSALRLLVLRGWQTLCPREAPKFTLINYM